MEAMMTAAERRAWARYKESMEWAMAAGGRGDAHRARLGLERAWAQLGVDLAAANLPPPRPRYKPELKILASTDLPVFVPPSPPPANDVRCVTCEDTGRLADGRPCQFCARTTDRPALANDVEEPTAIEGATQAELPVIDRSPDVAALEASINLDWALQDGRTLDAYDAALARIDAELAKVAARKAAGAR